MYLAVNPYSTISYQTPGKQIKKKEPSFLAHPDFHMLKKDYNITASSYFRRGQVYGSPCDKFIDIVKVFSKIFREPFDKPQKMLIAGIGDSQEPFSYLALIKNMLKQQDVRGVVDLHVVDLQSKPSNKKLKIDSFFDQGYAPDRFAPQSFIKDTTDYGQSWYREYRVKDDIFELVKATYNSKEKSKWNARVQDAIKTYEDNSFDIISANNTLLYIKNEDEIYETLRQMYRCLKPNGHLIVDPYYNYIATAGLSTKLDFVEDGIYRKL